ncbi:hypothetical protein [Methanolobus psychrotolerans]|uniref:hypothetical protein n=1 Tax=Methanolobus psychrotolerans TaxID=1874706 RepID=UPI000B918B9B|nr:hypothetical protein [Methanolobus psychrotolerans]
MRNELGENVPENVIQKGKEMGCMNCPKYIYMDGKYNGFPAASIGGKKASRFHSLGSANANKVMLGDGWVAFRSPSHGGSMVKGSVRPSVISRGSAMIGGFDGAAGLWKSLEEHRGSIYSNKLRNTWDEILAVCHSFKDKDVQVFSRRDGFSCIISGLKVLQLKLESSGLKMTLFRNVHNPGKRSVHQIKNHYNIDNSDVQLLLVQIKNHLDEQSKTIGQLRKNNSIGYMEKWLHNLLIESFELNKIEGLELDFLYYEVPLGKVKRNMQYGREHADIFARDSSGSLVIIEVKESSFNIDDAVRQGISYVKWVDDYKYQLKPRTNELGWDVDLDSLKLYVIAPGHDIDKGHIEHNLGETINDYDVTVILINEDWHTSRCIGINKVITVLL